MRDILFLARHTGAGRRWQSFYLEEELVEDAVTRKKTAKKERGW
jgi:hypothetical protein